MPHALSDSVAGRTAAPPSALECSWTDDGQDAAWAHVAGALDLATAPQREQTLDQPQLDARLVVLDLRELEFIDGSGVHAIVTACSRGRQAGRRLVLLRGPPNVNRMFTVTGSSDQLKIGELNPAEPPIRALPQLAEQDCAS